MWSPRLPEPDELPEIQRTAEHVWLRYEDVCQDGRLMTIGMPHVVGAIWKYTIQKMPIAPLQKQGVVPILSNMWMEGTDAHINLMHGVQIRGGALLGHTVDEEGAVNRLILDLFCKIYGTAGYIHGMGRAPNHGEEVLAGQVYARHVFTKPFAPREERKVLRLECPGVEEVPAQRLDWTPPEDFQRIEGMSEVGTRESELHFGLHHTDSNQHVNSLVYPRLFEDAAQSLLASHDEGQRRISTQAALSFRKPFFAGQPCLLRQSLLRPNDGEDGQRGVCGSFQPPEGRPHAYLKMVLG